MKRSRWFLILCLAACLILPAGSAAADQSLFFTAEGRTWEVVLPAEYLPYTTELGQNSPLLKASGSSRASMDQYMAALSCSVCCVHTFCGHQLWLSVKDHSAVLGRARDGLALPEQTVRSYLDGTAVGRGPYTTETSGGRQYYVFADGPSINDGGISYRICTFIGHFEVMLRWESGTGIRSDADIAELKAIIRSVQLGI